MNRTLRRPRRIPFRHAWAILPVALLACGPPGPPPAPGAGDGAEHEYAFVRAGDDQLIRVDTRNGRTWRVPSSGDGGWVALGGAADAAGKPERPGRYQVSFLPPARGATGRRVPLLVRLDHAAGRAWVMLAEGETTWLRIEGDEAEPAGAPADEGSAARSADPPPSAPSDAVAKPALQIPDAGDQGPVDLPPDQVDANLEAFEDAIEKQHLPSEIRVWSIEQLGRYDAEQAGPLLMKALDDGDPDVVVAAIQATGRVGYAPAIPRILKLRQHPDARVRAAAMDAVKQVP